MRTGATLKLAITGFATLIVALLMLSPSPVKALCAKWDVSGKWNIEQENPTAHVEVDLKQSGTEITGTATYDGIPGKVKGTIVGEDFNVEISDTTGKHVFRGVVGPERIAGAISIQGASEPKIWYSTSAMKCVEAGPAPSQN